MGYKDYEWNKARSLWTGEVIPGSYWVEDLPAGWVKAFGEEMCKELDDIIQTSKYPETYLVMQVKEKFGGMRWYCAMPQDVEKEIFDWEDKYSELSEKTCVYCGEPATMKNNGWICPVCDKCLEKR